VVLATLISRFKKSLELNTTRLAISSDNDVHLRVAKQDPVTFFVYNFVLAATRVVGRGRLWGNAGDLPLPPPPATILSTQCHERK